MTLTFATMVLITVAMAVLGAGVSAARFRGRTCPTGRMGTREGKRVNCRGEVLCPEPLVSPVTGQEVLAYRVEVYATWTDGERVRTKKVENIRRVAPFSVDDGSGPLPVRPSKHDKLFPEQVSFDQSRSISLAKSVTEQPELYGPQEFPVAPNLIPGGLDSARVVERVVPVPKMATAVGEVRAGALVGGRHFPLWLDGTARRPWHGVRDWFLPEVGQAVLRGIRWALDRMSPQRISDRTR
jgi:hypothetical protein